MKNHPPLPGQIRIEMKMSKILIETYWRQLGDKIYRKCKQHFNRLINAKKMKTPHANDLIILISN